MCSHPIVYHLITLKCWESWDDTLSSLKSNTSVSCYSLTHLKGRFQRSLQSSKLKARRSLQKARKSLLQARTSLLKARTSLLKARRFLLKACRSFPKACRSLLKAHRSLLTARRFLFTETRLMRPTSFGFDLANSFGKYYRLWRKSIVIRTWHVVLVLLVSLTLLRSTRNCKFLERISWIWDTRSTSNETHRLWETLVLVLLVARRSWASRVSWFSKT